MKPYGREKRISQNPSWKIDYHLHKNGRKLESWWEGMADILSRTEIKRRWRNKAKEEIE